MCRLISCKWAIQADSCFASYWQFLEERQDGATLQLAADEHLAGASTPWTWKTDFAMSRPIVVTACISGSSESWSPQQQPRPWHLRAGGGAVHSIMNRHSRLRCDHSVNADLGRNYRCPPTFGVLPDHRPKGQVMHARRSFINPNASVLGFLLGAPTIPAPTLIRAGALLENLLRA